MAKKNENKKLHQSQPTINVNTRNLNKYLPYALIAIIITTVFIYFNVLKFDFIYNWDDQDYIIDNPDIKNLNIESIKQFFTTFYNNNYQPVTMVLYAIEYKLGNGNSFVFHLFNIIIHFLNTVLVFKLIQAFSPKNIIVPLITASLFAIHPMHIESVAWISELKDVLYSCFFLSSLIAYTHFLRTKKHTTLIIVIFLFLLACMSKSAAVILPLVLLAIDYYYDRTPDWRVLIEKIPFFAISLLFGIVAIKSQGSAIKEMAPDMSALEHIAIVSFSFCSYLVKALLPFKLSALYPYPLELQGTLPIIYYLSILLLIIVFAAVWFSQKWGKEIAFGFMLFLLTILLVIQFVPVGAASMADRYTYIPYIGLFFIIGNFVAFIHTRYTAYKNILSGFLIICFISYSILSYSRVNIWKNDETLFTDVINKYPHCSIAYLNRGTYFYNYLTTTTGNDADKTKYMQHAITDFENALKYPLSDANKARAYLGLGKVNGSLNNFEAAIQDLTKCIAIDQSYRLNAFVERGSIYLNHYAGEAFLNDTTKRNDYLHKSINDFKSALKLQGKDNLKGLIYYNLSTAESKLGNLKDAISYISFAIKINPNSLNGYFSRCGYEVSFGDYNGGIADCNLIIQLDPQNTKAYFSRAYIEYEMGDFKSTINDLTFVLSLDKNNSTAYTLRGNAYNNLKKFSMAIEDYNKAIEINPNDLVAIGNRNKIR